jgi:hypothetical protein
MAQTCGVSSGQFAGSNRMNRCSAGNRTSSPGLQVTTRLDHPPPAHGLYLLGVLELLGPPSSDDLLPRPPRPHGAVESGEVQVRDWLNALGEHYKADQPRPL